MLESGEKILAMNIENRKDYIEKFNKLVEEAKNNNSKNTTTTKKSGTSKKQYEYRKVFF